MKRHSQAAHIRLIVAAMAFLFMCTGESVPVAAASPASATGALPPLFISPHVDGYLPRSALSKFYTYDAAAPLDDEVRLLDSNEWFDHYEVSFQCEGETVYAHYLVPLSARSEPVPCVLALHAAFVTEEQFLPMAAHFAKHGLAVLLQSLPYHHRRSITPNVPMLDGTAFVMGGPERVRDNVRRAVVEARRALDWLATRQEVDHARISIAGASLGGIVSSICFKMDTRLASAALIATGSGLAGVVRSGTFKPLELARQVFVSDLVGWGDYGEVMAPVEPARLPDDHPRPVFMLNATADELMHYQEALDHFRSYSQATQVWCDSSHFLPAHAAQMITCDFLIRTLIPQAVGPALDAGGWHFAELVRQPIPGENRLWVDLEVSRGAGARAGAAGGSDGGRGGDSGGSRPLQHALGVPLLNKLTPMVVVSRATLDATGHGLDELAQLPAILYITEDDSDDEYQAALAYFDAMELGGTPNPAVYRVNRVARVDRLTARGELGSVTYSITRSYPSFQELMRMLKLAIDIDTLKPIPTLPTISRGAWSTWVEPPTP